MDIKNPVHALFICEVILIPALNYRKAIDIEEVQ